MESFNSQSEDEDEYEYEYEYEYASSDDEDSTLSEENSESSSNTPQGKILERDDDRNLNEVDGKISSLGVAYDHDKNTKRRKVKVSSFDSQNVHCPAIQMVDSKSILRVMKRAIGEVSDVLSVSPSAAAPLLRHHKWNQELLYECFTTDEHRVKSQAGVSARCASLIPYEHRKSDNQTVSTTSRTCTSASTTSVLTCTCSICFDDELTHADMKAMPCGHEFCRECWTKYLTVAIEDGSSCIRTTCPQMKCQELVTEEEVQDILSASNSDLVQQYQTYQLRNYIEMSGHSRWCPGPNCDRVASVAAHATSSLYSQSEVMVACCDSCPTSFCVRCGEEPHSPLTCSELEKWKDLLSNLSSLKNKRDELDTLKKKFQNDKMWMADEAFNMNKAEKMIQEGDADGIDVNDTGHDSAKWVLGYTKKCPKCKWRIQKNQGCSHMRCRQCGHEFCWICLQDYFGHAGAHDAKKCREIMKKERDTREAWKTDWFKLNPTEFGEEAERALQELNSFVYCHDQYQQRDIEEAKIKDTIKYNASKTLASNWMDSEFYDAAMDQLLASHRLLKYSHALTYFLSKCETDESLDDEERHRMEKRAIQLENHRTTLSGLTDSLADMISRDRPDQMNRLTVVNQTRAILVFTKNTSMLQYDDDEIL